MIRLALAGPDTLALSSLCARCPAGPAGCCATPPGMEWSDAGRIVGRGGASFLLRQIAEGSLYPGPRGLNLRRVDGPAGEPRRCVFLGVAGCTLPPEQRAATCNYYVCEDALIEGGEAGGEPHAVGARRARDRLTETLARWDGEIGALVAARWPEGPPWDEGFLAWLGERFAERVPRRLRLGPPPR